MSREHVSKTGIKVLPSPQFQILRLATLAQDDNCFDLIFIDAPYKIGLARLGELIGLTLNMLKKKGVIIIEHLYKYEIRKLYDFVKTKKYGQTGISYVEKSQK